VTTFTVASSVMAQLEVMDPMYWLGAGGVFASAVLAGIVVIVFIETGLFFPFLPGDTLLFAAGLIAAQAHSPVEWWSVVPCAALAAIAGGQCSYLIGRRLGPALFKKDDARLFKRRYLTESHDFFERHGAKALIVAPFIGVVRTFTPVVAGISVMRYRTFLTFNVVGSTFWALSLTQLGYFLGNVELIAENLEVMVLAIAVVSTLPVTIAIIRTLTHRGTEVEAGN
jgi:membrane-associated protein